jgi:tetratricopeptide (TPR) repeat protein
MRPSSLPAARVAGRLHARATIPGRIWRSWLVSYDRDGEKREDFERAAQLAPDEPSVLVRLGAADLRAEEGPTALKHATRAMEAAPGRVDVLEMMAHAYAANGRCDEAMSTEQRAIDARYDAAVTYTPRDMLERQRNLMRRAQGPARGSAPLRRELQLRALRGRRNAAGRLHLDGHPRTQVNMRRFAPLLLLLSCAHVPPRSQDPAGWLELESEHFVLRTDLPADEARKSIADMELVRAALLGAGWHSNRDAALRLTVVQLANRKEMNEFARKGIEGFSTNDVFGRPIIVTHADDDVLDRQLFKHELTHAINAGFLVTKPRWVDEGIACYLETLEIKGNRKEAVMGKPDGDRLAYLQQHPVSSWFGIIETGSEMLAQSAERGYALETGAWALVHYFVDTHPQAFDAYLTQLARGTEAWRAFDQAFPGLREADLAAAMHAYLKNGKVRLDSLPLEVPRVDPSLRKLPQAEALALRADLFRLSPGYAERKQLVAAEVAKALAADPGNPYALALSAGSDAKPATATHPDDWRSWVVSYDHGGRVRADIEHALKLAPDDAGVLARVVFAELESREADRALAHANKAVALAPGRPDVLDALAQVYAATSRCDEAQTMEQRAIDAFPDAAVNEVPQAVVSRLRDIRNHCGEQPPPVASRSLREVKIRSCKRKPPVVAIKDDLRVDFTIREDGKPADIRIDKKAPKAARTALQRYIESCSYEPVLVDGKALAVPTTMIVSPPSKRK